MLDRTQPPPFQKSNAYPLIQPATTVLPNGLAITCVPGGEQEVAKIEFIFKTGKWQEHQSGVSYFTAQLLQKGTVTKNSFQISSEFDQYGVHVEISPGNDFTSLTLYGLTKNIARFFDLSYELITQPQFREEEIEQAKAIYIQGLKINLEKTSFLASRLLRQTLFGKAHPYGRDVEVSDVEKIQRESLLSFHKNYYRDFEIICSGKISKGLLDALTIKFGQIQLIKADAVQIDGKEFIKPEQYLEKKNTIQSSIRFGKKIVSRTHADYPALLFLNHILGGYFGSRLMKNIREEKGLTYGIYSSITSLKHDAYLSIGADVNKDNRELTVQEIKNELGNLRTQLIGKEELETARNHFIGSFQAELATPFAHADKIKNLLLHNLPTNHYQELVLKIDALQSHDLIETAQKYFDEASFAVVAAG
jgi:zinc protease